RRQRSFLSSGRLPAAEPDAPSPASCVRANPGAVSGHRNPMTSRHLHPAWIVLVAVTVCALAASGIRNVFGIYIKPMEAELGWTRGALSGAAALSLFLLGAVSPWVGRMADRWSARRLIVTSLAVLGVGAIAMGLSQRLWHIYVTAGILMAAGSGGAGIRSGAPVGVRWVQGPRRRALGPPGRRLSARPLSI